MANKYHKQKDKIVKTIVAPFTHIKNAAKAAAKKLSKKK
jgi:hypothetical protein